jgi:HEAT repeat protein
MFVDRVGRAAGGVLLLLLISVWSLSVAGLSIVASAVLVLWIITAVAVRKQYIQAFRQALERKAIEPEALDIKLADWGTVGTLVNALTSDDPRKVLYAFDLLGNVHPRRWRRYWPTLLRHPSSAVRARTLAMLAQAGEGALSSAIQPLLHDPDVRVQIEAIHYACTTSRRPAERLREFLAAGDPRVIYAAVQCMGQYRLGNPKDIDAGFMHRVCKARGDNGDYARAAGATALGLNWSGSRTDVDHLMILLSDSSSRVVSHAIRTIGDVRFEEAIPALIERLSAPRFRRVAREALLKFGEEVVPVLARSLSDPHVDMNVRVRVPQVLASTGRQAAVALLLDMLHTMEYELDYPIIKALNHARVSAPRLLFDSERVTVAIDYECRQHRRLRLDARALETIEEQHGTLSSRARDLLVLLARTLRERTEERVERVFRLLGLLHPPEDMYSTYLSHQAKPELRASAIEFLDNILDPPLKDWVVPLLDDGDTIVETSDQAGAGISSLQALMIGDDWWLRIIALELGRELEIPEPAGVETHADQ